MNKEILRNVRLGLFVIAGIVLLIIGLYLIGSNRNMFGKTFTLYARFQNVNGLKIGNNVRYAGIDIGTVEDIQILNDTIMRVEMSLEADLKKVIRKNSQASLGTDGLMGEKLINIAPGTIDVDFVTDKEELASLPTVNTEEMLRTLEVTNRNIAVISANLRNITQNISESRGTLYTVLMDTLLALKIQHTLDNIQTVSANILQVSDGLNDVVSDARHGNGLLGTLVKDTVMSNDLGKAISEVKTASLQINTSAGELKHLLQKANSGTGTIATLINDTVTANNLKQSLVNVEISTRKFSENMEALKHNFLFRGYFKKLEKNNKR